MIDMEQERTMIEKLYFGEISPHEYFCPRLDSLYRREMEELDKQEEKFRRQLPDDMLRAYNKVVDGRSVYSSMENEAYFAEGFRTGVRLMAEAFAPQTSRGNPRRRNRKLNTTGTNSRSHLKLKTSDGSFSTLFLGGIDNGSDQNRNRR